MLTVSSILAFRACIWAFSSAPQSSSDPVQSYIMSGSSSVTSGLPPVSPGAPASSIGQVIPVLCLESLATGCDRSPEFPELVISAARSYGLALSLALSGPDPASWSSWSLFDHSLSAASSAIHGHGSASCSAVSPWPSCDRTATLSCGSRGVGWFDPSCSLIPPGFLTSI